MCTARFRRSFGVFAICGLSLIALALATALSAATPTASTTTFTDPDGRFSLQVPAEWVSRQPSLGNTAGASGGVDIVASWDGPRVGAFNIAAARLPAGTTLDAYVKAQIADIKQNLPDATIDPTATQSLTLGGQPARQLNYTGTPQSPPGTLRVQIAHIIALQNNVAYTLTFVALPVNFDAFMESARVALDSFTFLKPTVASSQPKSFGYRLGYVIAPIIFIGVPIAIIINIVQANKRRRARRAQSLPAVAPYGPGAFPPPPVPQYASAPSPASDFSFVGGPGDVPYRAVIITGALSASAGAEAERQYLVQQFGPPAEPFGRGSPGWTLISQSRVPQDGHQYDVISVGLPDGTRRDVWFDVSSFVAQ